MSLGSITQGHSIINVRAFTFILTLNQTFMVNAPHLSVKILTHPENHAQHHRDDRMTAFSGKREIRMRASCGVRLGFRFYYRLCLA